MSMIKHRHEQKPRLTLFDLPLELRQIIYQEILINSVKHIFNQRQHQDLKKIRYEYVGDRVDTESKHLPTTIFLRERPKRLMDLKFPAMSYVWGSCELSPLFTVCRRWWVEIQSVMGLHWFTCFVVIDEPYDGGDWEGLLARLPKVTRQQMRNLEIFAFVQVSQDPQTQNNPLIGKSEAAIIRKHLPNLRKVTLKFGQRFEQSDYYSLGNPKALKERRLKLQALSSRCFGDGVDVECMAPPEPMPYFAMCPGYGKPLTHQAMLGLFSM